MELQFENGKTYQKENYTETPLPKGEYEQCIFTECDFSNADLSEIIFWECEFIRCNLSLVKVDKTGLRDTRFRECKMLGIPFYKCSEFGFSVGFNGCTLDNSSFVRLKMQKSIFEKCRLRECDFSGTELAGAVFDQCDLLEATFDHTNLEKADLTTSFNYTIDPEENRIKKAKFGLSGLPGLLSRYDIRVDREN